MPKPEAILTCNRPPRFAKRRCKERVCRESAETLVLVELGFHRGGSNNSVPACSVPGNVIPPIQALAPFGRTGSQAALFLSLLSGARCPRPSHLRRSSPSPQEHRCPVVGTGPQGTIPVRGALVRSPAVMPPSIGPGHPHCSSLCEVARTAQHVALSSQLYPQKGCKPSHPAGSPPRRAHAATCHIRGRNLPANGTPGAITSCPPHSLAAPAPPLPRRPRAALGCEQPACLRWDQMASSFSPRRIGTRSRSWRCS